MQVQEFIGTARQFEEQEITLNGNKLTQIAVNLLAQHGLIEVIGEGQKPARGKTPKLYKAVSRGELIFSGK